MKIKFYCDSGANIHSKKEDIIDMEAEWDITDEEWAKMSEKEKYNMALEWAANNGLEIGWEELPDKEMEVDQKKVDLIEAAGHSRHCATRQVWGDGECECGHEK